MAMVAPRSDYSMREPCRYCGNALGRVEKRGGQNCVLCGACGKLCYNAPKHETGETVRSLSSRPDIKPAQRMRILERDNHACISCGESGQLLVIGHLISVKDGFESGMTDRELYDDENLAAFCEECNSGLGGRSINVRLMWRLQQIWQQKRKPS